MLVILIYIYYRIDTYNNIYIYIYIYYTIYTKRALYPMRTAEQCAQRKLTMMVRKAIAPPAQIRTRKSNHSLQCSESLSV